MGNLNLQVFGIAFNDSNPSNNPAIRVFDLGYKLLGQPVNRAKSEDYDIAPGAQLSVFNGTRTTAIDGTTAFTVSQPNTATTTYRFTSTGGTPPVFRTDRLLGVDTTTELTVTTNGPISTFIEAYANSIVVNSTAGVPGHVYQFTFNGTPIVYTSQPFVDNAISINSLAGVPGHVYQFTFNGTFPIVYASQPSQIQVNSLAGIPGYVYQFNFNGTTVSYTSIAGDTYSSIVLGLQSAFGVAIAPSVATATVTGTGPTSTLVLTAAVLATPFTVDAVDPQLTVVPDSYANIIQGLSDAFAALIPTSVAVTTIIGTGASTALLVESFAAGTITAVDSQLTNASYAYQAIIEGLAAAFAQAVPGSVATAAVSGTGPASTLTITSTVLGGSFTIAGVDSQLTNTVATTLNTTNVVVGDILYVGPGAGFSQANQGYFTIIAKSANSLTIQNLNSAGQTAEILDPTQFIAYSNGGGVSNQVQVGDKVIISAGFSQATQGTYEITAIAPLFFEVAIAAPNGIPIESNIIPTATGMVFYSAAKQFILIAAQQTCSVQVNGDTSNSIMLQPTEPNNQERPALYLQQGTVYSLSVTNLSLETLSIIVASAE